MAHIPPEYKLGLEEAMANMISAKSKHSQDYLFYAHILAQCKVTYDTEMEAPAGVNFMYDHFNLYINPLDKWVKGDEAAYLKAQANGDPLPQSRGTGDDFEVLREGFNSMPLEHRLGVLKHEMLHIILKHIDRRQDRNHTGFNIAADCALNQMIERNHLPDGCIFPDNFPSEDGKPVPYKLSAEEYYELIKRDPNGEQNGAGEGFSPIDDHSKWDESKGDAELQEDIAKNMLDRAISQTQKARGNVPGQISEWLANLTKKREVDWRQVLRRIVSNKKANVRKTLMRPDRRLPDFNWVKGRTKDRTFEAAIISDVSGSVSDEGLQALWGEVIHICKLANVPIQLVQVDTQPTKPEPLTKFTKQVKRKACGGTILHPAIDMLRESKVSYSVLIVTTDGYLDESDVAEFHKLKVPVIWLIEPDGKSMESMSQGKHRVFHLK